MEEELETLQGGGGVYWVVETCGEVILTIQTFSKAKNNFL